MPIVRVSEHVARKPKRCSECFGSILAGDAYTAIYGRDECDRNYYRKLCKRCRPTTKQGTNDHANKRPRDTEQDRRYGH